ncbi:alpha/beta hydrolase [Antrihabitans stalactiti]|uniref:Alpha/beta hydrolase n=1 Tax=Antrihabitans stalactiti TaxID=2584121 RepID=A0A848KN82_9NOCA|nr:alpha/beta hydrolase [Antrihabitans stalactiti]NMN98404.1 alpha/beta hydrolase [Antrihabitans stalactiti]
MTASEQQPETDWRVKGLLAYLGAIGWPPMHSRTVPQARHDYRIQAAATGSWESVSSVRDTLVRTDEHDIPVRVYRPEREGDSRPLLMWFHGGGFVVGDLFTADGVCRRLANLSGATVVSVHYRRAPEHPLPAAYRDALAATEWAVRHAHQLGADATRLVVAGDSAGGGTAAHVAQQLRDNGPVPAALQVLFYPGIDFSMDHTDRNPALAKLLDWDTIEWFGAQSMPPEIDRRSADISPHYAETMANLPPAIIVTAGVDPFRADAIAYADRLTGAGVPVTHWDFPGQIHGFVAMDRIFPAGREAVRRAARAIAAVGAVDVAVPALVAAAPPIDWSRGRASTRRRIREASQRTPHISAAQILSVLADYRVRRLKDLLSSNKETAVAGHQSARSTQ